MFHIIKNICYQNVFGPFGCSLPVEIPKSFEPIFINAKKAIKNPKTANKYIIKNKIFEDNKCVLKLNPVQNLHI